MKRILLLILVGASLTCPVLAQDNDSTPPPPHGGPGFGGPGFHNLTPAERKQLFTDRQAALKANPDLADQEKALHEKMEALEKQIAAAMIQQDPSVAPVLAKIHDGPRHHKDGGDDSTPPADSGSSN